MARVSSGLEKYTYPISAAILNPQVSTSLIYNSLKLNPVSPKGQAISELKPEHVLVPSLEYQLP